MIRFASLAIRGMGNLPHYGPHPGTAMLAIMMLACGLAGIERGGLLGFLLGVGWGAVWIGPFYIYGAYDRARGSDALEHKRRRQYDSSY